jgi:hypothetical protein
MVVGVYFWSAYVAWSRREFSKALELKGNRLQHARHDGTLELAPLLVLASSAQRPFQKKRSKKRGPLRGPWRSQARRPGKRRRSRTVSLRASGTSVHLNRRDDSGIARPDLHPAVERSFRRDRRRRYRQVPPHRRRSA